MQAHFVLSTIIVSLLLTAHKNLSVKQNNPLLSSVSLASANHKGNHTPFNSQPPGLDATNSAPFLIEDYSGGLLAQLLNWRGLFAAADTTRLSTRWGLQQCYSLISLA